MRPLLLAIALVASVSGCKKDPPPPEGVWVGFDDDTNALTVYRDDTALLVFPVDGLQLGVMEQGYSDNLSYDPVYLEDVDWYRVSSASLEEDDDGGPLIGPNGLSLQLAFGDEIAAHLSVRRVADQRFEAQWDIATDLPVAYYRLRPQVDPAEGFYGLGEFFDTPEHRGKTRAMQTEIDGEVESGNNEAHFPIPLLIGTTGWGLFVEDRHPGLFEVATESDDRVQVTFGLGEDATDGLTFHLYAAPHPLDVTRLYYDTTGDPLLPAPWALGPWVWRDENDDQAQVLSDLQTMRDLDLPASGYWIDRPYASGINTFDFEPSKFPEPQAMIDTAHDLGFRMALWHVPYVDPEESPELRAEADAGGYFPPVHPPVFNNWSEPVDLTNPEAFLWWRDNIERYTDMGIEGFKLDYAEDIVIGLNGGRLPYEFYDGSDERTMHARYQLLYHEVYAYTLPASGGFLLCRAGTYGDQVNVSVVWPGDLDATLEAHREPAPGNNEYVPVGGLPAAVVASLSLGPSGFPFFGSDTGGYRHAPPDREVFTRWFEHTALSTVMQIGTNSNDVAWEFEEANGFDEQMLGWYREYTRLHIRLFPYEWTYAQQLAVDGRPIQRPLGLAYPELGVHPPYDYLFGDDLLVAPVVSYGARDREVVFPPGRWIDWFTGAEYQGGRITTVPAPLDKLPLFLREGGIVPLLRPTVDTLAPTAVPDEVESWANDPGVLWPVVFPAEAASFVVHDGALIETERTDGGVHLRWEDGDLYTQGAVFTVLDLDASPTRVRLDGVDLPRWGDLDALISADEGWAFTFETGGRLYVRVPGGSHDVQTAQ